MIRTAQTSVFPRIDPKQVTSFPQQVTSVPAVVPQETGSGLEIISQIIPPMISLIMVVMMMKMMTGMMEGIR